MIGPVALGSSTGRISDIPSAGRCMSRSSHRTADSSGVERGASVKLSEGHVLDSGADHDVSERHYKGRHLRNLGPVQTAYAPIAMTEGRRAQPLMRSVTLSDNKANQKQIDGTNPKKSTLAYPATTAWSFAAMITEPRVRRRRVAGPCQPNCPHEPTGSYIILHCPQFAGRFNTAYPLWSCVGFFCVRLGNSVSMGRSCGCHGRRDRRALEEHSAGDAPLVLVSDQQQ